MVSVRTLRTTSSPWRTRPSTVESQVRSALRSCGCYANRPHRRISELPLRPAPAASRSRRASQHKPPNVRVTSVLLTVSLLVDRSRTRIGQERTLRRRPQPALTAVFGEGPAFYQMSRRGEEEGRSGCQPASGRAPARFATGPANGRCGCSVVRAHPPMLRWRSSTSRFCRFER